MRQSPIHPPLSPLMRREVNQSHGNELTVIGGAGVAHATAAEEGRGGSNNVGKEIGREARTGGLPIRLGQTLPLGYQHEPLVTGRPP